MSTAELIDKIDWQKMDGLVPAVVQHVTTQRVLMLGYMNREALQRTVDSGLVTFYSRSRQQLWTKGETSGNTLTLASIESDCDHDALVVHADPAGPTCHLNTESCFDTERIVTKKDSFTAPINLTFLSHLHAVIEQRKSESTDASYTAQLFDKGVKRMAQKVGEEGVEVALAAVTKDTNVTDNDAYELINESADLLFHLMVLLSSQGLGLQHVVERLESRHSNS